MSVDSASARRELQDDVSIHRHVHSLHQTRSSVLSLAADNNYIFSGTQSQDISVWDKKLYTLRYSLQGHTGSILALEIAQEKQWLLSSSGDSTVRVWSTGTLRPIYVLNPYLETSSGDLFSLAWSPTLKTIFIGCQNTSLQWYDFRGISTTHPGSHLCSTPPSPVHPASGTATPSALIRKVHKFFDSYPQYERKPADLLARNNNSLSERSPDPDNKASSTPQHGYLSVEATNVIDSAHYGYIYCMAVLEHDGLVQLATGSGDETVKLWDCSYEGCNLVHEFDLTHGAVFTLVACRDTIYAGCQDGCVKVLDLETKTTVRTIIVQEGVDIISMSLINANLYTCSADGWIKCWSASFDRIAAWKGHDRIALSSTVACRDCSKRESLRLITGGNDGYIKVWEVLSKRTNGALYMQDTTGDDCFLTNSDPLDDMVYILTKFVAMPSVSSRLEHREDCRQTAIWLKKIFAQIGGSTTLLPTGEGNNPLVLATFTGSKGDRPRPRVLFYGHYDVISAPPEGWNTDPFTLTGHNGYLYGRGVTDNKGPIIAVACAAAGLLARRALGVDLVLLIEGGEECGSPGFEQAVQKHKDAIGHVDAILVSNSTWIGEADPCITYGLRGVIHCALEISSSLPDLHSGIEGGGVVEPMSDMVKLLSMLTDGQRKVLIPGFYDHVRLQTSEEQELYKLLSTVTQKSASSLSSRWREPSLTIHNIEISAPKNASVIPSLVKAQVSLRIVPDQDLDTIIRATCGHLENSFSALQSPNKLQVQVQHTADWWLGNLGDTWFKALESAVQEIWGVAPLRIREGGSIPSVPWLEKEFGCHALHLPMGQSSDRAHLPNERISLENLQKGKAIVEHFLMKVSEY